MTRFIFPFLGVAQLLAATPAPVDAEVKLSLPLREVAAHLGEGGAHYSVTNIAGDAEKIALVLDEIFAPMRKEGGEFPPALNFEKLVRDLEIHRVTALGQSAHRVGDYWHNRMFLATGGHRDGLLSVLGGKGTPFVGPGYALPDTDLVVEIEVNLKQARDVAGTVADAFGPNESRQVREALAEEMLEGALTIGDFLGKFEMRLSVAVTLDPTKRIPVAEGVTVPGATLVARLDGGKWLWDSYHDILAEGAEELKRDGLEILMAPEPMDSPLGPIQPLLAMETASGSIWAALREEDLEKVRKVGGERLVGSASFRAAMAGLPAEGNALVFTSPRLMGELNRTLKEAEQNLPTDAWAGIAMASAYLPAMAGEPMPYAAVIANNDEGILLANNGPEPIKGQSMLGSSGMIVAFSAMATPQIFKALSRAQDAENVSKAKQVVLAQHTYAIDNDGSFAPSLEALIEARMLPADSPILSMTCGDKELRSWVCVPGLTNVSPSGQILLYGPEPSGGKRVVARVDGSVQLMPEAAFQELLAAQKEARK
jgi:hypothetical protein